MSSVSNPLLLLFSVDIHASPELLALYQTQIEKHNEQVQSDPHPNSGFDLFVPKDMKFTTLGETQMIDFQIKAQMFNSNETQQTSQPFYLFPRSSISKTPLVMSNHVGVIDSGYRGFIMGAFRCLYFPSSSSSTSSTPLNFFEIKKHTRLVQICHPSLQPFQVRMVKSSELSALGKTSSRGNGGFGSTGL
jgi:dUTP pyrophosphatase